MITKNTLIKIGNFFFKTRNYLFPIIVLTLFLIFPPPAQYYGYYWLEDAKDILSGLLILVGLSLRSATIGWAYIKRGGLNKKVYADTLVTSGYFGMSRNPLYVGNMMIYSGIFLAHGNPIVIILGTGLFWFIYESIIAAEENFLCNKFGKAYEAYCRSVPRWRLDISKYKEATKNMTFSYLRALSKDYTTIFNSILALASLEVIEHYFYYPEKQFIVASIISGSIIGILLAGVFFIKYLKRKKYFEGV